MNTIRSHAISSMALTTNPLRAHGLDLSVKKAAAPITNARGGPSSVRIPPRDPMGEPHPKPGMQSIAGTRKNQGIRASQKLVLPNLSEFVMSFPLVITHAINPDVQRRRFAALC